MKCELIGFASQGYSSGERYSSKNQLGLVGEMTVLDNHEIHRYGDFKVPVSREFLYFILNGFTPSSHPKLKITIETIE